MITRAAMDQHVSEGRAQRWTRELGPDRLVIQAVQLDGRWFVIPAGADHYEEASAEVAAELNAGQAVLAAFDGLIAGALSEAVSTRDADASPEAGVPESFSRSEMAGMVDAGHGQRHRVAGAGAVRIDGAWWTISDDERYRAASPEIDTELEQTHRRMIASDEHVERARSAPSS